MGYGARIAYGALRGLGARLCLVVAAAAFVCAGAASPALTQVTETVLWTFSGGNDGTSPVSGLIRDATGALFGTTGLGGSFSAGCLGFGCGTVFKLTPPAAGQTAWTKTLLASFSGGNDGDYPIGGLFARNESPSRKKAVYGTTSGLEGEAGVAANATGTIFKVTDGTLTTLWNFTGGDDGAFPESGLIANEDTGTLYGTASFGGASGNGTVFKIETTDQTLSTIWSFSGGSDGAFPSGTLLAGETGALYGTTSFGATLDTPVCAVIGGCGTVFKLTPPTAGKTAWTLTTLWSFSGGNDGASPFTAGLIADETGALYGTTGAGGAFPDGCGGIGCGTVFKLTPPAAGQTAWTLMTLWSFSGGTDGGFPTAGLIADGKGALYGTTYMGGAFGAGVVFKLTPPAVAGQTPWNESVLWPFTGGSDGQDPAGGLIADQKGALYGTTQFGGTITPNQRPCESFGCGVVFKLTGTGFATEDGQ
jgi:uncharacterized repeat protein (TIGR03803 family)